MTVQTRSQLLTVAETIRDEVATGANTCLRVGGFCVNLLDSLLLEAENAPRATVVATSNITLSGISTTIDGVLCNTADTDVVLCSAQSSADENGPWVVQSGPWTRPAWFPTGGNAGGRLVRVQRGTVYADSSWLCTTDDPNAVIDTDNLTWQRRLDLVSEDGGTMTIGNDSDVDNVEIKTASSGVSVSINTVTTFDIGATGATFANVSDATDYTMIKPSGPYTRITRVTNGGTELKALTLAEDYVEVGEGTNCDHVYATVGSGGDVILRQGSTQFGKWDNAALEVSPAGATVSASGVIRVPQSAGLWGVCSSGPTDAPMITGNNPNLEIGDAAWISIVHDSTSGHEFYVASARLVHITTADLRVYDTADATQYVAYGHGTIYGSNVLDSAFVIGVVDATGSNDGQDMNLVTASSPAGQTPGDLIVTLGNDTTPTVWASFTVETSAGDLWTLGTGGMTLYDHADATAYVTVEHDAVLFSKGNTGGVTIDMEDVTAAANGNDLLITGSGCPYGQTPGNITIQASATATNNVSGSIILNNGAGNPAIEVNSVSASTAVALGFYGATPRGKQTISGARDDPEAALADLLASLALLGLITDSTTAS